MAIEGIQSTGGLRRVAPQNVWQTPQTDDAQQQASEQMALLMQAMQAFMQAVTQLLSRGSGQGGDQSGGQQGTPGVGSGGGVPPAQQSAYASPAGPPQQQGAPSDAASQPGNAAPAAGNTTPAPGPAPGGAPTSIPGVTRNAGGVPQADAVEGVSSTANPQQVKQTGTGNDKTYNVTNATSRDQSFTYSTNGVNKSTITLKPGETGAFVAGSGDMGVRISPSDAEGKTHPNTVLYEDGGAGAGQAAGVGNADISKVDGDVDYGGRRVNMTVTLSNGRTAGDGNAIHSYMYSTDDAGSMGLAGDPSKTASVVLSDA